MVLLLIGSRVRTDAMRARTLFFLYLSTSCVASLFRDVSTTTSCQNSGANATMWEVSASYVQGNCEGSVLYYQATPCDGCVPMACQGESGSSKVEPYSL